MASLQVGVNPTIPAGSNPAEAVKGNLVVDGRIYGDGSALTGVPGTISGLNANYLTKATSSTGIGDSQILDDGTNIGIGTATPQNRLHVYGSGFQRIQVQSTNSAASFKMDTSQSSFGFFASNNENRFGIYDYGTAVYPFNILGNSGNIGIGTTAPVARLDLVGAGTTSATSALIIRDANKAAKVTVLDSGNVGIGSATPNATLAVRGVASMRPAVNDGALFTAMSGVSGLGLQLGYDSVHDSGFLRSENVGSAWKDLAIIAENINMGGGPGDASALYIRNTGNIGIGTTAPVTRLHVGDAGSVPNVMPITGSDLYVKGNIELDGKIYGDGSALTGISGTVSGLNAGYIPRADAATTIVDSTIYQNGNNVGVGTTGPTSVFSVNATTAGDGGTNNGDGSAVYIKQNTVWSGQQPWSLYVADGGYTYLAGFRIEGPGGLRSLLAVNPTKSIGFATSGDQPITFTQSTVIERMRIAAGGNVGVGTSEPVAKLHIGDAGAVPNAMSITGSDLYVKGNIELDGRIYGDGSQLTGISGAITGLTAMRIPVASGSTTLVDSNIYSVGGNVGIGTTNPGAQLEMNSTQTSGQILRIDMASGYSDNAIFLADSTGAEKFSVLSNGNVVSWNNFVGFGFIDPVTNQQGFKIDSSVAYIKTANQTRMMVLNDGNIGIGTITPVSRLDLVGAGTTSATSALIIRDANYAAKVTVLDNGNMGIGTSSPSGTLHLKGAAAKLYIEDTSTTGSGIYFNANGGTSWVAGFASYRLINGFEFYAGNISTPKMVLVDTGNVGIGTSVPGSRLHIGDAGSVPNAMPITGSDLYVKGNIEFDGRIYGDGSALTGLASSPWTVNGSDVYYNTGKVGIGTTNPISNLTLGGSGTKSIGRGVNTGNLDLYGGTDYTDGAYFKVTGSALNANPGNSSGEFTIGETTGTYASTFSIYSFNGSVWTPRVRVIGSSGNVGIGMLTPLGLLDVNGKLTVLSGGNVGVGTSTPVSTLDVRGSVSYAVVSKTANYTAAAADRVILVNASSGSVTITLPAAAGVKGRVYDIKKTDSSANAVIIDPNGAETVDGQTTLSTTSQNQSFSIISDGSAWWVI